jgi:hypothetical protein
MALTANAGIDQTVNDDEVLILTGQVTPAGDPSQLSVLWTQLSGPDCILTAPTKWLCPILELYAGTYVFTFTATYVDDTTSSDTNTASDTCSVTVSSSGNGPIFNLPYMYPGFHY